MVAWLPQPEIGEHAWRRVVAELDRVAPDEGLAVPLLVLSPRDPARNPCAPLGLEELAAVTIARAVLVPPALQRNSPLRVAATACADRAVNAQVVAQCLRYPRLRPAGHLHSHPFAWRSTWPSSGALGDVEGHMLPMLQRNQEAGLDASFSFIACRDARRHGWVLQGFAMDAARRVHALGPCRVIADQALVRRGDFTPGLDRQPLLRGLWLDWTRSLRARGLRCRCDILLEGWQRCVVEVRAGLWAVFLLPVDFPARASQAHLVLPGATTSTRFASAHLRSLEPDAWARVVDEVEVACRVAA